MQASKYILMRAFFCGIALLSTLLSGCGEKTPEQIAAENKKQTEMSVRRAQVLMFEEKSPEAIKLLEETYQKCGSSAELCEALAYAYMQNGQLASAAMFFENAASQKGGDAELQISAAKAYEQSNAFDSASRAYEKYLKLKPSDAVAWRALSECFSKQEKYQDALTAMLSGLKAAGRNPNTAEAARIGNLFVKIGNAVQGRKWLEAAFKATLPENTETRKEILLGLVTIYLSQKETALLEEAVAELDKISPKLVDEKYPALRSQIKDFRAALSAVNEAIKAEKSAPPESQSAKSVGQAASSDTGESAAGASTPDKNSKSESSPVKPSENSAAKNGDGEKGGSAISTSEGEASKTASASESQKTSDAADEKPDMTEKEAVDAVKTEDAPVENSAGVKDETSTPAKPSEYDALVQKCYDAIAKNDAREAEKSAHMAIAKNPEPEAAWRALAKAYELSKRDNDSYMAAAEAYKRNPDDIDATLFYLRNASRVLNNEKFLNKVYRAYEKFPNNPEIWVDLARTYKLIGNKRNAVFFYNYFLANTPKEHVLYDEMAEEYKELSAQK